MLVMMFAVLLFHRHAASAAAIGDGWLAPPFVLMLKKLAGHSSFLLSEDSALQMHNDKHCNYCAASAIGMELLTVPA